MRKLGRRVLSALVSSTVALALPACDDAGGHCDGTEESGLGGKADEADGEAGDEDPMGHVYYEVSPLESGGMSFLFVDSMRGIQLSGTVDMFDAGESREAGDMFRLHLDDDSTYTGDIEIVLVPEVVELEGTDESHEMLVPTVITNTVGEFNESDPALAAMMADLMAKMDQDAERLELEQGPEVGFRAKRHKLKQCVGLVAGGVGMYLIKGFIFAPPFAIIAAVGLGAVCAGVMLGEVDLCGDREASISVDIGVDVVCD